MYFFALSFICTTSLTCTKESHPVLNLPILIIPVGIYTQFSYCTGKKDFFFFKFH